MVVISVSVARWWQCLSYFSSFPSLSFFPTSSQRTHREMLPVISSPRAASSSLPFPPQGEHIQLSAAILPFLIVPLLFLNHLPPVSHLLISPLDPFYPPAASPGSLSEQASTVAALVLEAASWPRALARDQSSDPGQPRPRLAPPRSGARAPRLPGLLLEERRLEREGGADWDTGGSVSHF